MTRRYTTHYRLPMPQFNTTPWHGDMEAALQSLDNLIYRLMTATGTNNWDNEVDYNIGNLVLDAVDGSLWQVRVSHTSRTTGAMSLDRVAHPTYWASYAVAFNPRGEWTNETAYSYYDWVYDSTLGIIAMCVTAHTSNASDTIVEDSVKWDFIADFRTNFNAADIIYDNDTSGLLAENTQEAIDELVDRIFDIETDILEGDIIIRRPGETITGDTTIIDDDRNKTIFVDTTSASPVITMPDLTASDDGWECTFIKVNTGINPMFILPDTGTIMSGEQALTKTRRCIPGIPFRVFWTGTKWVAERCVKAPLGGLVPFSVAALPVGYEWPNGQTLASASTSYPDFYAANGNSGVVHDVCGRVMAGKDNMGESSNNRLTGLSGGVDGDTLGATGGAESHTLTIAQLATHSHAFNATTSSDGAHTHTYDGHQNGSAQSGGGAAVADDNQVSKTSGSSGAHTHTVSGTSDSNGSDAVHNNVQPTIVENVALVVE